MFIETESTPNPATLKFIPGREVMGERGTADFASVAAASRSPLASRIFALPGVARVFLGGDFVTVTQDERRRLAGAAPAGARRRHGPFHVGLAGAGGRRTPARTDRRAADDYDPADAEIVDQIKDLLDTRVRPAVAGDGGDIVFRGFREGVVRLHLQGACSGCPSSRATLKHGVENMLRHYVPEVVAVEQVDA